MEITQISKRRLYDYHFHGFQRTGTSLQISFLGLKSIKMVYFFLHTYNLEIGGTQFLVIFFQPTQDGIYLLKNIITIQEFSVEEVHEWIIFNFPVPHTLMLFLIKKKKRYNSYAIKFTSQFHWKPIHIYIFLYQNKNFQRIEVHII